MQCRLFEFVKTFYIMEPNLSLLSVEELQDLFIQESHNFTEEMDNGASFDKLKKIRLNLKNISLEMKKRPKIPLPKMGGDGDGQ